jgi:hypothetical protein
MGFWATNAWASGQTQRHSTAQHGPSTAQHGGSTFNYTKLSSWVVSERLQGGRGALYGCEQLNIALPSSPVEIALTLSPGAVAAIYVSTRPQTLCD